jgi:hypothetical protein
VSDVNFRMASGGHLFHAVPVVSRKALCGKTPQKKSRQGGSRDLWTFGQSTEPSVNDMCFKCWCRLREIRAGERAMPGAQP